MNEHEQLWVDQARTGDAEAFSHLVEAYQRPVFNLAYRMLGNPTEAEDAAQETFLRVYAKLGQYDPERKFSTWILSIANNHCIDRLRKRRVTLLSIDDTGSRGSMEGRRRCRVDLKIVAPQGTRDGDADDVEVGLNAR